MHILDVNNYWFEKFLGFIMTSTTRSKSHHPQIIKCHSVYCEEFYFVGRSSVECGYYDYYHGGKGIFL